MNPLASIADYMVDFDAVGSENNSKEHADLFRLKYHDSKENLQYGDDKYGTQNRRRHILQ